MIVTEVDYEAEDAAANTSDFIRLKLTLEKAGVDQRWGMIEGDSQYINGQGWMLQGGVDADAIRVEAFNLDVPNHIIIVGDRKFQVPQTGSNRTAWYRYQL